MPLLKSSNLKAVEYLPARAELQVTFKTGRTYRYGGVPAEVYQGLLAAESPGRFFREQVEGKFEYLGNA